MCKKRFAHPAQSIFLLLAVLAWALSLAGCVSFTMPYNGEIRFHDIRAVIPKDFIRDSTQSSEDFWVFEHGGYAKSILLLRNDADTDVIAQLDAYAERMTELGAESSRGTFLSTEAVLTTYTKDGQFCQELLFHYQGSLYAFALRGGTEQEFQRLLDGIDTSATGNE